MKSSSSVTCAQVCVLAEETIAYEKESTCFQTSSGYCAFFNKM